MASDLTASVSRPSIVPSRSSSSSISDAAKPVSRAAVAFEYAALRNEAHTPLGMYVAPSEESLMIWNAVFFVHQGYYQGAVFKFQLAFPSNYPANPPTLKFANPPFHPLIDESGVFHLGPPLRPWRPQEHHIFHILHWVKAAFKKHALDKLHEDDAVSKGAFRMYHNDPNGFANQAAQSAKLTRERAMDKPSPVTFTPLDTDQLQEYRKKLGLQDWGKLLGEADASKPSSGIGLGILS